MNIDQMLREAVQRGASDLHLTANAPPMIRVNTRLCKLNDTVLQPQDTTEIAQHILGADRYKKYEYSGEIDASYQLDGLAYFRINIYRHQGYTALAFRIISHEIPTIEGLGLPDIVASFARYSSGLILVTGPTGNGKSTTLAAMINLINNERACHIITLEDPIEFVHTNRRSLITQREIGVDSLSFASALRNCLRQDPDVIMIGEMRDLETISTAVTAAETGHLVIATLHTINAPQAIERIIDVFPPHQQQQIRVQLANSLIGVLSQRLLPNPREDQRMIMAMEIMICNAAIRNMIREGKVHQIHNAMLTSKSYGMKTMDQAMQELMEQGMVSPAFLEENMRPGPGPAGH
ncbi:MAG: type IV pilus twitching motility protein PilT [Syntrophomonadaceae bacterium]|jgi:twitching motility protein PilT|nr:type IV pilus twitching motility protein PilT [Syntrophomonadaceae bacterium]